MLGVISVQGAVVPVVDMRRRLGLPERPASMNDRLILARAACRDVALLVDALIGIVELPDADVAAAESLFPGVRLVRGVAQCDGDMVFICDLDQFLSRLEERTLGEALAAETS